MFPKPVGWSAPSLLAGLTCLSVKQVGGGGYRCLEIVFVRNIYILVLTHHTITAPTNIFANSWFSDVHQCFRLLYVVFKLHIRFRGGGGYRVFGWTFALHTLLFFFHYFSHLRSVKLWWRLCLSLLRFRGHPFRLVAVFNIRIQMVMENRSGILSFFFNIIGK